MDVFATHGEPFFRLLGLISVARERRPHGAAFPHGLLRAIWRTATRQGPSAARSAAHSIARRSSSDLHD